MLLPLVMVEETEAQRLAQGHVVSRWGARVDPNLTELEACAVRLLKEEADSDRLMGAGCFRKSMMDTCQYS